MEKLYKGIHNFQESYFKKEKVFFKRLSKGQTPNVLFITCSDSRVDPNLLTQSRPGELMILRNIGNIVPPYNTIRGKDSVAAAIELAVLELKIRDIVVCGHSDCRAMQALYRDEKELDKMPALKNWLELVTSVKELVLNISQGKTSELRHRITEEENIVCQLHNIKTYPFVHQAIKEGKLHLHGWYYDIGSGDVYTFTQDSGKFERIKP